MESENKYQTICDEVRKDNQMIRLKTERICNILRLDYLDIFHKIENYIAIHSNIPFDTASFYVLSDEISGQVSDSCKTITDFYSKFTNYDSNILH